MLAATETLLVTRWMKDPKEDRAAIGETIGLMAQVMARLMGEIDVFIGSVDTAAPAEDRAEILAPEVVLDTDLRDLVADEGASPLSLEFADS